MVPQRAYSNAAYEKKIGYCRAIRAGDHVYVTGTAAFDDSGQVHAPGDAYAQTLRCFEIIRKALAYLGGDMSNVVRTRMFVTDISRWEEYGRAHAEVVGRHPPTATMVEVQRLIESELLIEIEVDAVCQSWKPAV